ncbi:MAG TPA: 50S ribosomal protein L11 methyltransferase [Acidimicrobiales bacterium]
MAEPIGWRTIVEVVPDDTELVADAMFQAGALGVEERHEHGRVTLIGGMPDEASARAFVAAHAGARVEPVADDRWADEWRKWAAPVRVGDLVVQPAWLHDAPPDDARFVISIDPWRAFGSGSHESTRLALPGRGLR